MEEHPIQGLMRTAMESIKGMVDVNTVVGDPVQTKDGTLVIPVSRVTFGFAAGGGDYGRSGGPEEEGEAGGERGLPFAGGSGAGVTVQPVGFLVVGPDSVRLLPVDGRAVYDRLLDLAPQVLGQVQTLLRGGQFEDRDERTRGNTNKAGLDEGDGL